MTKPISQGMNEQHLLVAFPLCLLVTETRLIPLILSNQTINILSYFDSIHLAKVYRVATNYKIRIIDNWPNLQIIHSGAHFSLLIDINTFRPEKGHENRN